MQRTMFPTPSSKEVTITGMSRSFRSPTSCSSTWKPSISGISMSRSMRSKASRLSFSIASRPLVAESTRWPCCSRLRVRRSRLTLLSSTTRSRAAMPLSAIAQRPQRPLDACVFLQEAREWIGARAERALEAVHLEAARHRAELERAEGVAVRLERMRGTAEAVGIARRGGSAQVREHVGRVLEERVHELLHEVGADRLLERAEGGEVDGSLGFFGLLGHVVHVVTRSRTWLSASTNRSPRIGFVK